MTDLDDLIAPGAVLANVPASSKKAVLTTLGATAAARWGLAPRAVVDALAKREKLGSTGFGGGVAIPHARLEEVDRVHGAFLQLARPVDFDAVDDQPVDLVFMLLSPARGSADHLKALARVSRRLREPNLAAKLRGAGSADALYALLASVDSRDAA
jgi:PTS system nitrogen regulatory IIA component